MKKVLTIGFQIFLLHATLRSQDVQGILACTYLGGDNNDRVICSVTDDNGFVYVAGETSSTDFPVTENAYQFPGTINISTDIFICKFDSKLETLISSTRIGGNSGDEVAEIKIYNNTLIVIGTTFSLDFPFTSGAYDSTHNLEYDAYIFMMDLDLKKIIASTFYGGSGSEHAWNMDMDNSGNIFIVGATYSKNLTISSGAFDTTYNGNTDGFIAKFSNDLTSLKAATYLGGKEYDRVDAITILENSIFVAGTSESTDYPVTNNALFLSPLGGRNDIIVSKLDNNLAKMITSTYFGGNDGEAVTAIDIDRNKNIYITGVTSSSNFNVTPNGFDTSFNGGDDLYISKFNNNLDSIIASTYLGGSGQDGDLANYDNVSMKISQNDEIILAGYTSSNDFPGNPRIGDTIYNGWGDIFVTRLNNSLSTAIYSTVIGGSGGDYCNTLCIDNLQYLYISGNTWSEDFPVTQNAYSTVFVGNYGDAFITKYNLQLADGLPLENIATNRSYIFPNPSCCFISTTLNEKIMEVNLYNIIGQFQMKKNLDQNQKIDITELSPGIYIIELLTSSGEIKIDKIIKM